MTTEGSSNEGAFVALYSQHYRALHDYASLRCPAADIDDVLADTFAVAWRRFAHIPAGMERAWLFGVVKNVLHSRHRASRRIDALHTRLSAFETLNPIDPGMQSVPIDTREQLGGAFNTLSDADRDILVLAAWFDMSGPQLALALGISTNAATVRLHRARTRFDRALRAWTQPDQT